MPGTEPLICDLDGNVLETARANAFIVTRDTTLVTPPTDGRILPGVTRADVLELAAGLGIDTEVRPVHLDELRRATELFVTGSLAWIEPALTSRDDHVRAIGEVTETLRTNLYKRAAAAILR